MQLERWLPLVPVCALLAAGTSQTRRLLRPAEPADAVAELVHVVVQVLRDHFRHPFYPVQIYCGWLDVCGHSTDFLDHVLGLLGDDFTVVLSTPLSETTADYRGSTAPPMRNLLLLDGVGTVVGRMMEDLRSDPSGRYLIVLTAEDPAAGRLDQIFAELFRNNIINVNVLVRQGTRVAAYTYHPFSPGLCRIARTHLVATWPPNPARDSVDLYPVRLATFHNCTLQVGSFEVKPYTMLLPKVDGYLELGGFEGDLLRVLSQRLQFRVNITESPGQVQWGTIGPPGNSTGTMKLVQDELVDLAIACMAVDPTRNLYLQSGAIHYTSRILFAVPPGRSYSAFEKLFRPFRAASWLALAGSLVVAAALVVALARSSTSVRGLVYGSDDVRMTPLHALYVLYGGAVAAVPSRNFGRTLFALWLWATLVLRALYQGSLYRYLQRSAHYPPLVTLEQVYESSLDLHMINIAMRFFTDRPEVRGRARFIPPGRDTLGDMVSGMADRYGDRAVVCPVDVVAYFNRRSKRAHRRARVHITREPITLFPVTIYYHKRSMLTPVFDRQIRMIVPSGLMQFWVSNYGDYDFFTEGAGAGTTTAAANGPRPLTNVHLVGAYQVLLGAYGFGLLALLLELLAGRIRWLGQLFDCCTLRY
ncbi:uncharacterized protein LOC128269737 [Anopheles cruzii]|uniref:uncharacterized protein LOC128269737 n=1 Tax=Anopheles cruzii TaxID=68878 RepID=UPI0022EC839E|nr:uncharacterized protein LOC128269737 [Anopheles cruzii]